MNMMSTIATAAVDSGQTESLLQRVYSMDNAQQRDQLTERIFSRWSETDTNAPLAALSKIENATIAETAMKGFMQGWMQSDREGALDYSFENQDDPMISNSFGEILRQAFYNGSKDENEALAQRMAEQGLADKYAQQVASSITVTNPELALVIAESVTNEKHRERIKNQTFSIWAHSNLSSALAGLAAIPDVSGRAKFAPSVAFSLARVSDGGEQLTKLFANIPAGKDRTKAIERIVSTTALNLSRGGTSQSYLSRLVQLAEDEEGLSDKAKEHLAKLTPPQS